MGALTKVSVDSGTPIEDRRNPTGGKVTKTFRATTGANADDEYIVTGLSKIDTILGWSPIGTTPAALTIVFVKNARGANIGEDVNAGDLGVKSTGALAFEVTVIGTL